MAGARKIPGLDGKLSFGQAAASAVKVRSGEIFTFADGVLDTSDPERVHDMRVACRRLRAALEIFADCFPKSEHRALLREVKLLADALGERRDPDVQIAALQKLGTELGQGERPGLNGLVAELGARQEEGNERVQEAIERLREVRLEERLARLAEQAAGS
jgi:CHAD domain-containing protein